jgi:hypothetical protein
MLIFEILLYVIAFALILYYPVRAMYRGGAYKYAAQPDGSEKVFKLVD